MRCWPSGRVAERGQRVGGLLHGEITRFGTHGHRSHVARYEHGRPVGSWTYWNADREPYELDIAQAGSAPLPRGLECGLSRVARATAPPGAVQLHADFARRRPSLEAMLEGDEADLATTLLFDAETRDASDLLHAHAVALLEQDAGSENGLIALLSRLGALGDAALAELVFQRVIAGGFSGTYFRELTQIRPELWASWGRRLREAYRNSDARSVRSTRSGFSMLLRWPERARFEVRAGVVASYLDDIEAVEGRDSDAYGDAMVWLAELALEEGHVRAARAWLHQLALSDRSSTVRSHAAGCLVTRFGKAGSAHIEALVRPSRPSPAWCRPASPAGS